jgi:hypothetical protein
MGNLENNLNIEFDSSFELNSNFGPSLEWVFRHGFKFSAKFQSSFWNPNWQFYSQQKPRLKLVQIKCFFGDLKPNLPPKNPFFKPIGFIQYLPSLGHKVIFLMSLKFKHPQPSKWIHQKHLMRIFIWVFSIYF